MNPSDLTSTSDYERMIAQSIVPRPSLPCRDRPRPTATKVVAKAVGALLLIAPAASIVVGLTRAITSGDC
jgi:hypothetical protein